MILAFSGEAANSANGMSATWPGESFSGRPSYFVSPQKWNGLSNNHWKTESPNEFAKNQRLLSRPKPFGGGLRQYILG
jgi:hypothetical protein